MAFCNNCGSTVQDGTTYCPNCGASVPVNYPVQGSQSGAKEVVSVGGWIGRSLISFIPIVGGLIYFIMLFVWSGNKKKEDSFRNWAKAQLIVMAIAVVLGILVFVLFGSAIAEALYYLT